MFEVELGLIAEIKEAFSQRQIPQDRIIHNEFNLTQQLEAKSVDNFFRQRNFIINRENRCLIAFNYLDSEAALAILPYYMISVIENFVCDDFMIDLLISALATGVTSDLYEARENIGVEMRSFASKKEVAATCNFIAWLSNKKREKNLQCAFKAATQLWCS